MVPLLRTSTPRTATVPPDSSHTSPPPASVVTGIRSDLRVRLPRWRLQRGNPPHHASKQTPRQMTLRQQQPVVPGVLDQTATRLLRGYIYACGGSEQGETDYKKTPALMWITESVDSPRSGSATLQSPTLVAPRRGHRARIHGHAYWHRATQARTPNHNPATEAEAVPLCTPAA
jgi:hypothetical protein